MGKRQSHILLAYYITIEVERLKRIFSLLLSLIFVFLFAGCGEEFKEYRPITDINNFDGRRIGCIVGWEPDYILTGRTDLTLRRYDSVSDMLLALSYKQLDGIAVDEETSNMVLASMEGISMVEQPIDYIGYTLISSEDGKKYLDEFDEWIDDFSKTAEYKAYDKRNHSFDGVDYIPMEIEEAKNPKGTIRLGYCSLYYPCSFDLDKETVSGMDVEIVKYFARDRGYKIEYFSLPETSIGEVVLNNKIDFYAGDITDVYRTEYTVMDGIYMSKIFRESFIRVIEVSDWNNLKMISNVSR